MSDTQKTELEAEIEDIKVAVKEATEAFLQAKKDLNITGISLDMNDEHAFCLSVCAFGRITVDYAEDLLGDKTGTKPMPNLSDGTGIMGTFDSGVVFHARHFNSALRNSLSILICFLIGYFGYGKVLMNENASIAGTAAILLSSAVGSAIAKNLNRLQGVVLGTVVGKLVWAITGWCTWWGYIALCTSLFFWNFLCLYVYYDSPTYGGIACLLAAFGSGNFLVGCTDPLKATFDPAGPYYEIINVVIAIAVMIFVDMALAPGRASEMACETFREAVKNMRKSMDELLDPAEKNVRVKTGRLGTLIAEAKTLGGEAFEEPRYWRIQWRNGVFNKACQTLANLRVTMTAMEYTVTEGGVAGAPKTKMFMTLLQKPQFETIQTALYAKFDMLEALFNIFEAETSEPLKAETRQGRVYTVLDDPRLQRDYKGEMEAAIKSVMTDMNDAIENVPAENLEQDQASQVSYCLSAFLMMMDQLDSCQQAIVQA